MEFDLNAINPIQSSYVPASKPEVEDKSEKDGLFKQEDSHFQKELKDIYALINQHWEEEQKEASKRAEKDGPKASGLDGFRSPGLRNDWGA
ncbi:MAG: hypothetical protein AB7F28_07925 [Candidatus Margulisiibacteriota bacterium]